MSAGSRRDRATAPWRPGRSGRSALVAGRRIEHRGSGALYGPKWTSSTTYTLLLLERLGLPPSDARGQAASRALWNGARLCGGGLTLARTVREPETCITGMLVKLAASFRLGDHRVDAAVRWLLDQQLDDGGWNCASIRRGSTHGSFHTSITVLEALLAYRDADGVVAVDPPMADGRMFFLAHRLYRSHRTGAVVDPACARFLALVPALQRPLRVPARDARSEPMVDAQTTPRPPVVGRPEAGPV